VQTLPEKMRGCVDNGDSWFMHLTNLHFSLIMQHFSIMINFVTYIQYSITFRMDYAYQV